MMGKKMVGLSLGIPQNQTENRTLWKNGIKFRMICVLGRL